MEFIQIAYCVTIPFLLLLWFGKKQLSHFSLNAIAVSNLLLILHSVFLIRQMMGFYFLVKQYGEIPANPEAKWDADSVRLLLIILLPYLSLIGPIRRNLVFTLFMLFLLYWNHPVFTWNTFDLFTKIPVYFSLLCSGYALLWLLKKLPYQSL